jgi:hypothetical protein
LRPAVPKTTDRESGEKEKPRMTPEATRTSSRSRMS